VYNINEWHSYSGMEYPRQQEKSTILGQKPRPTRSTKAKKNLCKRKLCIAEKKNANRRLSVVRAKLIQVVKENEDLKHENIKLKSKLKTVTVTLNNTLDKPTKRGKISLENVKESNQIMKLHTGLPTVEHFNWLYAHVETAAQKLQYWNGKGKERKYLQVANKKPGPERETSLQEELLITLIILKLNLLEEYVGFLFGLSNSSISQILSTWIPFLSLELKPLLYWPHANELSHCYPDCFKHWDNVTSIIDCFEIPTEKPSHVEANAQIFSNYKNRATVKFLLACTPGGSVSYISPPAGGNMSDIELVRQTNLISKFKPGEACMADKGFRMEGEFLQHGVRLIVPPFVKQGKQFTEENNVKNKLIAHARIHVERVIGRVRDYQILNSVVPISRLDLIGPAASICCCLTNMKEPVIRTNNTEL
jgi:regulator of replication initiation timing